VEPLAKVMRAAQEFSPEIIRDAPQSMLPSRMTSATVPPRSSLLKLFIVVRVLTWEFWG